MLFYKQYKKGAASFYIVAFSTLILMIVAISFAAVIISEVERTSNDDLSQSAYDSALAGIEDAKMAYYNYLNCKDKDGDNCKLINTLMNDDTERDADDCNMVWEMLGRKTSSNGQAGAIVESNTGSGNNMQQFTTCITINDKLKNYKSRMSGGIDIVKIRFKDEEGFTYDDIKKVKLSWFSDLDATATPTNYLNYTDGKVVFASEGIIPTPPTVYLAMLQTGPDFSMKSFSQVTNTSTNRGLVYLVPADSINNAEAKNYIKTNNNTIDESAMIKSNSKTSENLPYVVQCNGANDGVEFLCYATIDLPTPIGGRRNEDTFKIIVGAPYGQVFDFQLEFYCDDTNTNDACATMDREEGKRKPSPVTLERVQVEVDSTGRANDLYRRVVTRLKNQNDLALTVMGPLELLDSGDNTGLTKTIPVIKEYDFIKP